MVKTKDSLRRLWFATNTTTIDQRGTMGIQWARGQEGERGGGAIYSEGSACRALSNSYLAKNRAHFGLAGGQTSGRGCLTLF